MRIAFLGGNSQIARDLLVSIDQHTDFACILYSRYPQSVSDFLKQHKVSNVHQAQSYENFASREDFDVIINFVGVGNPAKSIEMGQSIFDITLEYDRKALDYLQQHPATRYVFLSSGAVYGRNFDHPVSGNSQAKVSINHLQETDWYGISKLYAEARHRALSEFSIIDIRVFNYFSHTQDMNAGFLITDIIHAIRNKKTFNTSAENIVRDFITPHDFFNLFISIVKYKPVNLALDCYTRNPIEKFTLLDEIKKRYALSYEISPAMDMLNATGAKMNYYSLNHRAEKLGYRPDKTSLEGVMDELSLVTGIN